MTSTLLLDDTEQALPSANPMHFHDHDQDIYDVVRDVFTVRGTNLQLLVCYNGAVIQANRAWSFNKAFYEGDIEKLGEGFFETLDSNTSRAVLNRANELTTA